MDEEKVSTKCPSTKTNQTFNILRQKRGFDENDFNQMVFETTDFGLEKFKPRQNPT